MSNKLLHIINWIFGVTASSTFGMWIMEVVRVMNFDIWLKRGVAMTAFIFGCFKIYDWIEKKCRRYKKLKNGTRPK